MSRCRTCREEIDFFRSPFTGNVRAFDIAPVDPTHPLAGVRAFPVLGRAAYKQADLVEVVQVQRGCSDVEAADEIRDMPWHLLHDCTTSTDDAQPATPDTQETRPS